MTSQHEIKKERTVKIIRGQVDKNKIFRKFGVSVRQTRCGLGLIAERDFEPGEILGCVDGVLIFDPDYSSTYCIDGGFCVLEPFAPFCYLNHSCEPNACFFRTENDQSAIGTDYCEKKKDSQKHFRKNFSRSQKSLIGKSSFIDENGIECYLDECFRSNCDGCPDMNICRSIEHQDSSSNQKDFSSVDLRVEAIQPIKKGDEITIDYAWPAAWAIPCHCGSPHCRGWIVDKKERSLLNGKSPTEQAFRQ